MVDFYVRAPEPDFRIIDQGSIIMIEPVSAEAKQWVDENVQLDGWQWLGPRFAVDHRMAGPLLDGIAAEFTVEAV